MSSFFRPPRRTWIPFFLAAVAAMVSRPVAAQPAAGDPPKTYEVQIDGESFLVESGQRPIKVESKLKKGTTYKLAVREAMTQTLRLNSVNWNMACRPRYMTTRARTCELRKLFTNLDFGLTITDLGRPGRGAPG